MSAQFKGRGPTMFSISLTGKEINDALTLLEKRAIDETNYEDVRRAVFLAERVRFAAKAEGFDRHIEAEEMRVYVGDGLPDFVGSR